MGFIKEFKEFAVKGNLVDIAVAFVLGGAFGKVVTSFTEGIVAPIIGLLGGKDLTKNMWVLKEGFPEVKDTAGKVLTPAAEAVAVKYGAFLTAVIDFIIVAFVMFLIIKAINSLKAKEEVVVVVPLAPTETEKLLAEIRDSLKK